MPRNDAAASGHVCPHIGIHAIDIVQPPGIGISPIADMDTDASIVAAELAAKSSAETPKKARSDACPETTRASMTREMTRSGLAGRDIASAMMQCSVSSGTILVA